MATSTQEVIKRLKNCSRDLHPSVVEGVLRQYMSELEAGGYSHQWRQRVLESALMGFEKMLKGEKEGTGWVNRPEVSTRGTRRLKRLAGRTSWFQPGGNERRTGVKRRRGGQETEERKTDQPIEGVMYVPFTPQSELKKKMQEVENLWANNPNSGRMRIVERLGPTIQELVTNPAPWKGEHCGREVCPPCETRPGTCRGKGVTYNILCGTCKEEGKVALYHVESNRTLLDRSLEHLASLRREQEGSVLHRHWRECHPDRGEPSAYQFQLKGKHRTPTERQLTEALNIQFSEADILLNAKTEFGRNCYVTVTTEYDEKRWNSRQTELQNTGIQPNKRRREDSSQGEETENASWRKEPPQRKADSRQKDTETGILRWVTQRNGIQKDPQRKGI